MSKVPITYISQAVDAEAPISWNGFLPPTFPQSLHDSLQNWSLHPDKQTDLTYPWTGVEASSLPWVDFYLPPDRLAIERVLKFYLSAGETIGHWASCRVGVRFATEVNEKWGFEHDISISRVRFRTNEPSLCWFNVGRHMWDHTDAHVQANSWNDWVGRFSLPVEFFVSEGSLMRRYGDSEGIRKLAQRGVKMEGKVEMGFSAPAENPPLAKWLEAFWDVLDSRCKELRRVTIELRYHELPPGTTREAAMQRLLSEALPHISSTIWNKWTINGFISKLEGLATLQTYSGPDDQHTVELANVELAKGTKVRLFLLIEKAGMRLAMQSRKAIDGSVFDKLERDSSFRFYRTPARERPAPTSYTLAEKQFLPPEGISNDPGPEVPFDLKKWTEDFHASQQNTESGRSATPYKK